MILQFNDHAVIAICHLSVAVILVWITVNRQWMLINPTVQFCLTTFWVSHVVYHIAMSFGLDGWICSALLRIKAIVSMPLILFVWPYFRHPDTLPDRIEWEKRISQMSTFIDEQQAAESIRRKRLRALAVAVQKHKGDVERLKVDSCDAGAIARAETIKASLAETMSILESLGINTTQSAPSTEASDALSC
jgi:hypothetical protein